MDGEQCRLVVAHEGPHQRPLAAFGKKERADLKDREPLPDLTAPRAAAAALAYKKRTRHGPHR